MNFGFGQGNHGRIPGEDESSELPVKCPECGYVTTVTYFDPIEPPRLCEKHPHTDMVRTD
jgi:hypothetical protein